MLGKRIAEIAGLLEQRIVMSISSHIPHTDDEADHHLHIICLDVPYPVDYGGVFDLFYKIKALSEAGVKIHLHCFEYGRGKQPVLEQYCEEVNYYERTTGPAGFAFGLPYIISSRANEVLYRRLMEDNYPVLMEGMHTTYFLYTGKIPASRCFVRMHNVEYQYYRQLAHTTSSIFKKIYFRRESALLEKYERALANTATFWTVSEKDLDVFVKQMHYQRIDYLPIYLPDYQTEWPGENGQYCLYHGNLSVPENEQAAAWLLENVFHEIKIPLVIAGKNPSEKLSSLAHQFDHTCLVANPDEREMQDLIRKAHINILPSLNETGIKLKLVNALYNGRHCIVNLAGVEGTRLNHCCIIANSGAEMQEAVKRAISQPFLLDEFTERMRCLRLIFNNSVNARQMISWIFSGEPSIPGNAMRQRNLASPGPAV